MRLEDLRAEWGWVLWPRSRNKCAPFADFTVGSRRSAGWTGPKAASLKPLSCASTLTHPQKRGIVKRGMFTRGLRSLQMGRVKQWPVRRGWYWCHPFLQPLPRPQATPNSDLVLGNERNKYKGRARPYCAEIPNISSHFAKWGVKIIIRFSYNKIKTILLQVCGWGVFCFYFCFSCYTYFCLFGTHVVFPSYKVVTFLDLT